jgi:hypothetical protein
MHLIASKNMKLHSQWENTRFKRTKLDFHPSFAPIIQKSTGLAAEEIIRFLSGFGPVRTRDSRFSLNSITGEILKYKLDKGVYAKV